MLVVAGLLKRSIENRVLIEIELVPFWNKFDPGDFQALRELRLVSAGFQRIAAGSPPLQWREEFRLLFFHGGRWQDYRLQSDKDGMYVTATTNKWSDITDVLLSLQGQTNETLNNPRLKARGFLTRCRLSRNRRSF